MRCSSLRSDGLRQGEMPRFSILVYFQIDRNILPSSEAAVESRQPSCAEKNGEFTLVNLPVCLQIEKSFRNPGTGNSARKRDNGPSFYGRQLSSTAPDPCFASRMVLREA